MFFAKPGLLTTRLLMICSVVAVLATAAVGCGEPVEPLGDGRLAVDWQVSPRGCHQARVEEVEIRLENAHRSRSKRFECSDRQAVMDHLSPATYQMSIVGFDAGGQPTFAATPRKVTVQADTLNETNLVRLTAKPAVAEVAWRFGNGRVCGANGVAEVQVAVYDPAFYELARQRFRCNAGSGVVEGLAAGDFIVEVTADADSGHFRGAAEKSLKRGGHGRVDVVLAED